MRDKFSAMPGFGRTMGFTIAYLTAVVLVPIGGLLFKLLGLGWGEFWELATRPRAVAAYGLTFGASLAAALVNAFFGSVLAWVLVRYEFPLKRVIDALVDIPFAMPTAVAGLTLANLFSPGGWLGQFLTPLGVQGAYSRLGVVIALVFVSLPFIVRTLQPVIENLEREIEEAAATLGASRLRTLVSIIIPTLLPAVLTGFALCFARAVGEYGSVIFISSNIPRQTEIAPLVVTTYLDEFEYTAAIVVAVVLLVISFLLLATINLLERWAARFQNG